MSGAATPAAIRSYEPRDLASCRGLWVELTQWHRELYDTATIGGDDPGRLFDEHLQRVGADNLRVATLDDRVVGLAGMIPGEGGAEVEPVVVSAACRGRGIGRQLVAAVVEQAKATGVRSLSVRPVARNAAALRFFHGLGFRVLGHVELLAYFPDRDWRDGYALGGRDFQL